MERSASRESGVVVLYERKTSVGRVNDISSGNTDTVQFLKGKRLNSRDIQEVSSKFLIFPVAVQHIGREDNQEDIFSIVWSLYQSEMKVWSYYKTEMIMKVAI